MKIEYIYSGIIGITKILYEIFLFFISKDFKLNIFYIVENVSVNVTGRDNTSHTDDNIPQKYIDRWQKSLDVLATIIKVPAALIMYYDEPYIEVFLSSQTDDTNPYKPGEREIEDGLYCETVIKKQEILDIPNALKNSKWDNNPDLKFGMLNYLGVPLNWPDGKPYGTICILDRTERHYQDHERELLVEYSRIIENYLNLWSEMKELIKEREYISEWAKIMPMCAYCRKIKNEEDQTWVEIEEYVQKQYNQETSHGICDDCLEREFMKNELK